jgi:aminopeptidase
VVRRARPRARRERGAAITLSGPVAPGLLDDLDPVRAGRDRLPSIRETGEVVGRRELNWTILPGATQAWADLVHPDLEPEAALAKLEDQLLHVLRLDEDDPVAAWRSRADRLVPVAPDAHRAQLRRACTTRAPAPT